MAAAKSANTRKTKNNAKTAPVEVKPAEDAVIIEEETIEEPEVIIQKISKDTTKNFNDTDLIPCLCVFPGYVGMTGKRSGNTYMWEDMGVTEYVEYQDLKTEVLNKKSVYIYKPLFIIEDDDFLAKYPSLSKMYEDIYTSDEIMDKIIDLDPTELKKFIESLPSGIKDGIKNIASTMMNDGSLYDIRKIRVIDKIFGTDLELYSQLVSKE